METCYEKLTLNGFLKEIKEVSSGSHPRKFCFVLGAGASKSSGIKSGQEFVDIWEKQIIERNEESYLVWKNELNITDENKYEFYSQYYEKRFATAHDGYNYLEKLMEHAKPNIGYIMLSYILVHTNHNVVITTNFDHLIEDAVSYYEHIIPLVIGHESLAHYIAGQVNRPTIIKIHRDLLLDPKNRTAELDKLHDSWKQALDIIFSEYYPIFIGYAGNDHSLMDFITENSEKIKSGKWTFPYWMIYKKDKMSEKVLTYLNKSNGYLIEHNGFDEVLYLIGTLFNYKLPTKKEFLSDAEKRYQMLSDFMNGFSEELTDNITQDENNNSVSVNEEIENEQTVNMILNQTEQQRLYKEALLQNHIGNYENAVQIYKQLISDDPKNARYKYLLGVALHEMKKYDKALKEKRSALELDSNNAEYHESLGVTLYEMGYYDRALSEIRHAVKLEPDNAQYRNSLAAILLETWDFEGALQEGKRAVEIEPDNAEYHSNYGIILHEIRDYQKALEEKKRAVMLEPDNAKYHNSLGATWHAMRQYKEAVKEKETALELEPDSREYKDSLAVTLYEME